MENFKAGDTVRIVSSSSGYNITTRDALCRIIAVKPSGDIEVAVVSRIDGQKIAPTTYTVKPGQFALATDSDYQVFGITKPKGEMKMKLFTQVSDYVEKHKDVLFTVALVLVLDHFVFEGKFKQKIEDLVSSFLTKHAPTLPTGTTPGA
jgi:hypothetical protein